MQFLEQKFKSSIVKSRSYFEEKQICQDQLNTQKERIQQLQSLLQSAKSNYAASLKNLEMISESIHKKRGDLFEAPPAGIREPGVGAESNEIAAEQQQQQQNQQQNLDFNLDDVELESRTHSRSASQSRPSDVNESDLEALRMKVKSLAVRPIEGGDGKQDEQESWESELNATVDKLDHLMLLREKRQNFCPEPVSLPQSPDHIIEQKPIKQLKKVDPLPLAIVSLQALPTSSNASPLNSIIFSGSTTINCDNLIHKKKRKLSLQWMRFHRHRCDLKSINKQSCIVTRPHKWNLFR